MQEAERAAQPQIQQHQSQMQVKRAEREQMAQDEALARQMQEEVIHSIVF